MDTSSYQDAAIDYMAISLNDHFDGFGDPSLTHMMKSDTDSSTHEDDTSGVFNHDY